MKAIEELIKIASIEGIDPRMGKVAREEAIKLWVKEYMVEIEMGQSIIKKSLTDEDQRFIKNYVVANIAEELFEDCVRFEITPNKVNAKVMAVKR